MFTKCRFHLLLLTACFYECKFYAIVIVCIGHYYHFPILGMYSVYEKLLHVDHV